MFWKCVSGGNTEEKNYIFAGSVIKRKFRTERVWSYSQTRINGWREEAHRRPAAQAEGYYRERSGKSQVLVKQERTSEEECCVVLLACKCVN